MGNPSTGITITIDAASEEAAAKLKGFFEGLNGQAEKAGDSIKETFHEIVAGLGLAFGVRELISFGKELINSAEGLGKVSQQAEFTIPVLSALREEMNLAGVSFDEVKNSLVLFTARIQDARLRGGEALQVFRDIGDNVAYAVLQGRPAQEVYGLIAEKMRSGALAGREAAITQQLFGRAFREWIPLLKLGVDGLEELQSKGGGISEADVQQAMAFNRELRELQSELENIGRRLLTDVLPSLKEFVSWLKDGALAIELGHFSEYFELSMKSAIQEVSNFFTRKLADWADQMDKLNSKATGKEAPGFWAKLGYGTAGVATGLLALGDTVGEKLGFVDRDFLDNRVRQANEFFEKAGMQGGILDTVAEAMVRSKQTANNPFKGQLEALRQKLHQEPRPNAPGNAGDTKGALENPLIPNLPIVSQEGQKLIDEIEKQYRQATETKLQLLDFERDERLKKLQQEFGDYEHYEVEAIKIDEIYAAQRRELLNKEAEARAQIRLAENQAAQKKVDSDPLLTQLEKNKQLLPILQQQVELVRENQRLNTSRLNDPALNEEAHIAAKKELVKLGEQEVDIERKIQEIHDADFSGTMAKGVVQLQSAWENLGQNLAGGVIDGIRTAVGGVTNAIMGAIEGTKTWGQVFLEVGRSIIASLINVVVQWVVSMTIIRALRAIFGAEDNQQAAQSAAAWAPAAIAASIASYGTAALIGTSAFLASIFTGTGIATGLSAGAGAYESGGVVPGGEQFIRVNENGTEAVLNARAVRALGPTLIDRLNSGISGAYQLGRTDLAGGISSRIDYGRGTPGSSSVNVQGHRMSVAFVNSRNEMRDWLLSSEGQKQIVDISRRRRLDIGTPT